MPTPRTKKLGLGQRFALLVIWFYRITLSPLLGGRCRFYPSCSEYGRIAFTECGFWRGFSLTSRRILRCHPWNPGGVDFPPGTEPKAMKEKQDG